VAYSRNSALKGCPQDLGIYWAGFSKLNKMGYKVFDPQINSLGKRRNKLFGPIPFNSVAQLHDAN
jgi:hypothetical protein